MHFYLLGHFCTVLVLWTTLYSSHYDDETLSLSLFAMNVILINFIFMRNIPESSHSAGVKLAKCVKIV